MQSHFEATAAKEFFLSVRSWLLAFLPFLRLLLFLFPFFFCDIIHIHLKESLCGGCGLVFFRYIKCVEHFFVFLALEASVNLQMCFLPHSFLAWIYVVSCPTTYLFFVCVPLFSRVRAVAFFSFVT